MDAEIKVFIDNFKVDTDTALSIQLKKQLRDVKEFSKKKTSFSKPIKVLFTQSNHSLFKNAFNINEVGGWDRNSRPTARIESGIYGVLEGLAKLDEITSDGYQFVIYKDDINLTTIFGDELIRGNIDSSKDISFANQYSFNFTRTNLRALMQSPPRADGKGINFGYANLISDTSSNYVEDYGKDRLMIPAIAARELLEETLLSVGKTITFSPEQLTYLNKIYIPFNGDTPEISNRWDFSKHTAKYSSLTTGSSSLDLFGYRGVAQFFTNYDKIRDESNIDALEYFLMGGRRHIGNYEIKLKLNIGYSIPGSQIEREIKPHIIVYNFDTQEANELTLSNITSGSPDDNLTIPAFTYSGEDTFVGSFSLQAPGQLAVYVMYEEITFISAYPGFVNLSGLTTVEISKLDSFYNEDTPNVITADKILPYNYKKIDLFNDIMTIFNSSVSAYGNNIITKTANEFNRENSSVIYADWSDLVDDESISLSTLLSRKSEVISYKIGDSEDFYNSDFSDQFDSGVGDLKSSSKTKTIVEKSVSFASTVRIDQFSSLINTDRYASTNLKPRLLFVNSITVGDMKFGLDDQGVRDLSITNFHILSNRFKEDSTATDNLILSFNNQFSYSPTEAFRKDTNGTIYNRFHKGEELLKVRDDAIIFTANFNLSDKIFGEVDFNDVIFIKTNRHGSGYYLINEISSHYIGTSKFSKVELIQIDLENLDYEFSASEINLNRIFVSSEGEAATSRPFTGGLSPAEVSDLYSSIPVIVKGRLTDLSSRSVVISFNAFESLPVITHLSIYRYSQIISGNWQKQEVLYKFASSTPLTTTTLSLEIDLSESLTGVIIEYVIQ